MQENNSDSMSLPYLSSERMAEVDRKAPEEYGITVSRMMENAAYQIADFLRENYSQSAEIVFYVGKGNNGGDGLAAARRLINWGFSVKLVLATEDLDGIRREELEILRNLGAEFVGEFENADVAVDSLIGYNLSGDPRTPFDELVEQVNSADETVSVDVPTGVDADTGERYSPAVEADKVLTLAMPKTGLRQLEADIWVLDISVPDQVYRDLGFETGNVFGERSRLKLG
jgi:NAD(P)H-hydrate epimerase